MIDKNTPSNFYKIHRPEYFSDSELISETTLSREVLNYELETISTNNKQDEFETLCRRMAEKFIAPNLIPQVGPTGGGDGKTDSETHPVAISISDRWFVQEEWSNNENWAFAISSKKEWRPKLKIDVKKIVETERGYTKVFFMTNQLVPSKKRKDTQDEFKKTFTVDIIILDREWILEKIYSNNLIDLVVKSLNLTNTHQDTKSILGTNDTNRIQELEKLEEQISDQNRYFKHDFQLVEDALESAILSRMLEKPKDEVEGKFNRALQFGEKVGNNKQLLRIYYQTAWTYLFWYDDYSNFIDNFKKLKIYISENSSIAEIEQYFNLFNSLNGLTYNKVVNIVDYEVNIEDERVEINNLLTTIKNNNSKPNFALIARTYKTILSLTDCIFKQKNPDNLFIELSNIILSCKNILEFPFESVKNIVEMLGGIFSDNVEYDALIDNMVVVSEQRNSELASAEIFLKRGSQKLEAKHYKESIVYFGKAVLKLSKEETQHGMRLVLLGMGVAYRGLGLIWASNNCYISACNLSFKSMNESGVINKSTYRDIEEIIENELFIGRIPTFLVWYEMYRILTQVSSVNTSEDSLEFINLMDGCLAVRLLHTNNINNEFLPDLLAMQELNASELTCLYKLGHNLKDGIEHFKTEQKLDSFYSSFAQQPFVNQMLCETNFMEGGNANLTSKILGCKFLVKFSKNNETLLLAETLLAFLESFFATSMSELMPHSESVVINLSQDSTSVFTYNNELEEYDIVINPTVGENLSNFLFQCVADILSKTFISKNNIEEYLKKIFEKEGVVERLSIIANHRVIVLNLLGNNPKLFFDDWLHGDGVKKYISKRKNPIVYGKKIETERADPNLAKSIKHNEIIVSSIIDIPLWNKAKWNGFGFCLLPAPQEAVGIIISYEDIDAGKKIFEKWMHKIGKEDKSEEIRISIIKGVDKNNPYWYRVHICKNINNLKQSCSVSSVSRFHEMNADSQQNLERLVEAFNLMKRYNLYPALNKSNGKLEPLFDYGILKTTLIVKDAWSIGEDDIDMAVIKKNDNPIIPEGIKNAPVLQILTNP